MVGYQGYRGLAGHEVWSIPQSRRDALSGATWTSRFERLVKSLSGLVATSRDWSLFVAPMIPRLVPPPAGYPHRTLAVAAAAKGCRESPIQVPLAVGCRGD